MPEIKDQTPEPTPVERLRCVIQIPIRDGIIRFDELKLEGLNLDVTFDDLKLIFNQLSNLTDQAFREKLIASGVHLFQTVEKGK